MAAARVLLFLCLSLLLFQTFARENFVRVSNENGGAKHPEWSVFWHQHPPVKPGKPSWLPNTKWPLFPHPPLPSWRPKTNPPLPSWLPKTKWPFPNPPLPSWLPKTKWPFPHPPLPSWIPKAKHPFPHPPLPSWLPKTKWHFPVLPPLPFGGFKWPWLPHHHNSKTLEDNNKALETRCHSTPAVIESCMKEGTFSFSHTSGYKFSTQCCKSVAEIKDDCSDGLYLPVIKSQCLAHV